MMSHGIPHRRTTSFLAAALAVSAALSAACLTANGETEDKPATIPTQVSVAPVAAIERPIARFMRASGTLMADQQAEVAAETSGRIVSTPVERGSRVGRGDELVRLSPTETDAQVKEAEANAAQIEARLGLTGRPAFEVDAVPEVQSAKAAVDLAQNEFVRIQALVDQRVVSQSEFEQRRTQLEATRQQYEAAKNSMSQQYQSLQAARARITLARKALADTVVRAPFNGLVAERLVSVGDYVTRGTKIAVVVRVDPLRAQLTVPEQFISAIEVGQPITFEVDAFPNRTFTGKVRFVSPTLRADQRALTVEAVVPNDDRQLKPGLFVTARLQQPKQSPAILVPAAAVQTSAGTSRAYVVTGGHVEERVVTLGQAVDALVEVSSGIKAGERVATTNLAQLVDGTAIAEGKSQK